MNLIDRIGLYTTIFANHQDDVQAETSSWALAYNTFQKLLRTGAESSDAAGRVRKMLIRDKSEIYYAWVITAFAPWTSVPTRIVSGKAKPLPPRASEVARDSLRSDNKTINILRDSSNNWKSIIDVKSSLLEERLNGTAAEIRQQVGLHMRSWGKEWRLQFVLSILQEVMQGHDFSKGKTSDTFPPFYSLEDDLLTPAPPTVIQEYDAFLEYMVKQDLKEICEMKPIANGDEIMKHMKVSKGPWMSKVIDAAIKWQLLYPEVTEKEKILEALSSQREELGIPPQK